MLQLLTVVVYQTAGCKSCCANTARGTLETCRKSRMPLGLELSNVSRCVLFSTNSAMNLRIAVDTCRELQGSSWEGWPALRKS